MLQSLHPEADTTKSCVVVSNLCAHACDIRVAGDLENVIAKDAIIIHTRDVGVCYV